MQEQEKPHLSDTEDQNEFGLPETHYDPIDRGEEEAPSFEPPVYYEAEEETNNTGWIVGGVFGLVVVIAAVAYLFFFDGLEQVSSLFGGKEPEPIVQPESAFNPEPATPVYEEPAPEPVEKVEETPPVNALAPYQEISMISARTGMSYIVVASFVDEDMAQDLGNKMLKRGVGTKIIAPSKRSPLQHRVVVAEFDTFQQAMQQIANYRSEYGDKVWVLKY